MGEAQYSGLAGGYTILQQTTRGCPKTKGKQTEQKRHKASVKIPARNTILVSLPGHNPHGCTEPAHVMTVSVITSFQVKVKGFNAIIFFPPIRAHHFQVWAGIDPVGHKTTWHGTFLPAAIWMGLQGQLGQDLEASAPSSFSRYAWIFCWRYWQGKTKSIPKIKSTQ